MKPFNLDEFKAGKKAITRNGEWEAEFCFEQTTTTPFPIICKITQLAAPKDTMLLSATIGGVSSAFSLDLFMPYKKRVAYAKFNLPEPGRETVMWLEEFKPKPETGFIVATITWEE